MRFSIFILLLALAATAHAWGRRHHRRQRGHGKDGSSGSSSEESTGKKLQISMRKKSDAKTSESASAWTPWCPWPPEYCEMYWNKTTGGSGEVEKKPKVLITMRKRSDMEKNGKDHDWKNWHDKGKEVVDKIKDWFKGHHGHGGHGSHGRSSSSSEEEEPKECLNALSEEKCNALIGAFGQADACADDFVAQACAGPCSATTTTTTTAAPTTTECDNHEKSLSYFEWYHTTRLNQADPKFWDSWHCTLSHRVNPYYEYRGVEVPDGFDTIAQEFKDALNANTSLCFCVRFLDGQPAYNHLCSDVMPCEDPESYINYTISD